MRSVYLFKKFYIEDNEKNYSRIQTITRGYKQLLEDTNNYKKKLR
jgi:hypothetical protein